MGILGVDQDDFRLDSLERFVRGMQLSGIEVVLPTFLVGV